MQASKLYFHETNADTNESSKTLFFAVILHAEKHVQYVVME